MSDHVAGRVVAPLGGPVLCLVEHDAGSVADSSVRALSFSRALADSSGSTLVAAIVGEIGDAQRSTFATVGVSNAYEVDLVGVDDYAPRAWARALLALGESIGASALVGAGTDRGNEVMAYAGATSHLPMVANCLSAARSDDGSTVRLRRQRWAGSLIEESTLDATPALLSVAYDGVVADVAPVAMPATLQRFRYEPSGADLAVKVAEWRSRGGGVSLADARVVVGGGRGVGSEEGFAELDELAALMGAAVGVSRVVTSLGWRPHAQQVGQTGTRISPELYLACGISGATQHLAGCRSAKRVVTINIDADAPILSRADYAIVGDVSEIVPALSAAIMSRRARAAGST